MNTTSALHEWELWMKGMIVNTIRFDFSLTIFLHNDKNEKCSIQIECPFIFIEGNSKLKLDPRSPQSLCGVLQLLGQKLININIDEEGVFVVEFQSHIAIRGEYDDQFEAWQIMDKNSRVSIICLPGGGLG